MDNAKIISLEQTENGGLFTICYESKDESEFENFINRFKDDATCKEDLHVILTAIQRMLDVSGFIVRRFRPVGKMKDCVCAIPVTTSKLRLYCLRISDSILIVGNGGRKQTKTYEESDELNGYVIKLQKLDALIKAELKQGSLTINGTMLDGINDKTFKL